MKLDPKKVKPSEEFSNHAVQGFATEECPKTPKESCFAIATGFGGMMSHRCGSLTDDGECTYKPEKS